MGTVVGSQHVKLPDRYLPIRRVASGGMASVWCATDRLLGRRVAIKILSEPFVHDRNAVLRFKREARAAARLSGHPHVVTIYDVGQMAGSTSRADFSGRPFIVMEYLAGGTLADALRVGAVSREDAVRWVHEAASALDYAHGQGVLHRDIKLVNLLLDCERVLHVADFGIARLGTDDTLTRTGEVFGTAAYLAPERALGHPATEASDRYSLAVAAFELLVGERPFAGGPLAAQARQHLEAEPPRASRRNPELPRAVDAVIARGMAKRPEDRWPSATAFAEAVDAALVRDARTVPTVAIGAGSRRTATRAFRAGVPASRAGVPASRAGAPASPGGSPSRAAPAERRPGRAAALAALAVAVICIAAIAIAHPGSAPRVRSVSAPSRSSAARRSTPVAARAAARPHPRHARQVTGTPAAATTPAPTADALEGQGHALMVAGNYQAAIPVLRQALAAARPGTLTYAYALFDLGRSLRLAGDPRAAVPLLWARLQIPNQTDVVRHELQLALEALGAQQGGPGGGLGDYGHGKHKGHGNGN